MGKGSSSAKTPVEQPDTLKNKQLLSVLDLISEGPIKGFANSARPMNSVLMNGTNVENESGDINISGITVAANWGTPDQSYLDGFADSKGEVVVNVDVKYNAPVVRTITTDYDRLVLKVGGTGLFKYKDNGDMVRTDVSVSVEAYYGGTWHEKKRLELKDQKSKSEWLMDIEITDLPNAPYDLRVVRLIPDSTTSRLVNDTFWRSYTTIDDSKQSFPYCAVIGCTIDSEQFGSSPTRNYLLDGLIVPVPSNYDPVNRTYTGFWNGQFKPAYTNNPVWLYLELMTNSRFGCGDYITESMLDIQALYQVAKYCDESVDDGFGGQEPRFTLNAYITEQRKAIDLLNDLTSVFNGMPVWVGTESSLVVDFPSDIVAQYTNANVIGDFQYTSTELNDRYSVVEVSYADPRNGYEKAIEYVSDQDLINRYGYISKKVTAFGTTSRGQARRLGLYILESSKQETRSVSFKVGTAGLRNVPGDIIEIADNDFAGAQMGGRILDISADGKSVTIDRTIEFNLGDEVYIGLMEDKTFAKIKITAINGDVVTLERACVNVTEYRVFTITKVNLQPRTFRCLDISFDQKKLEFQIQAVQHAAKKYSDIDNNVYFGPDANTGSLYGGIPTPKNLSVKFQSYETGSNIVIRWDCPTAGTNIKYRIKITRADLTYFSADVDTTQVTLSIPDIGNYIVSVLCVSIADNRIGTAVTLGFTIAPPSPVQSISWTSGPFDISLRPIAGPVATLGDNYQWFFGATEAEVLAETNYLGQGFVMNKTGLRFATYYWFGCRVINPLGVSSIVTVHATTQTDDSDLIAAIAPGIPNIDYIKEMNQDITGLQSLASLRVVDPAGGTPRISGVYVNAGDAAQNKASVVDFLADYVAISSPDKSQRWVYFDSTKQKLTVLGDIQAQSGTLNNVTVNENCTILGTLSAAHIVGDVSTSAYIVGKLLTKNSPSLTITYAGGLDYPIQLFIPYLNISREGTGAVSRLYIDFNGQHVIGGTSNVRSYEGAIGFDVPAGAVNQVIRISGNSIDDSENYPVQSFMIVASPQVAGRFVVS